MDEKYIIEMCWRYIFYCYSDEGKLQRLMLTFDRNCEMILSCVSEHICQIAAFLKVYMAKIADSDSKLFKGLKVAFFDIYHSYLSKYLACYHEVPVLDEEVGAIFREMESAQC